MKRLDLSLLLCLSAAFALAQPAGLQQDRFQNRLRQLRREAEQEKQSLQSQTSPAGTRDARARYDAALGAIAGLGTENPSDPAAQRAVGAALYQAGEPARALAFAERSVALAPGDPEALLLRAHVREGLGQNAGAVEDARKALLLKPGDPEAIALVKLLARRVDSLAPASAPPAGVPDEDLLSLEAGAPASPQAGAPPEKIKSAARARQAAERLGLGDYAGSAELAGQAIRLDPENPKPYLQRALARLYLGKADDAVSDAERAARRGAGAPAYNLSARARLSKGDFPAAKEEARQALGLDPSSARALYLMARAREGMGESPQDVLADYRRAAELNASYRAPYEQALARMSPRGGGGRRRRLSGALAFLAAAAVLAAAYRLVGREG